ncbi:hypothetical protein LCGC14_1819980 [marine sediment metagenome]|uniref:Uncharacterized protein n=1 Tax=marine sediment metagenome TaxID=412755 RepID=A0A0F9GJ86_9ZZZZ
MRRILRTINFKNKRLEQYSWHKEGDFIVKRDMLIQGFPIILKYKIKKSKMVKDLKIWCTKCDVVLKKKGVALDCPEDGIFYVCPKCEYKIVVFENERNKQQKQELIAKFLSDLKGLKIWANEHKKDAYDPIGSLIDDIDDTLIAKWEGE